MKKFDELRAQMSPESRTRVKARLAAMDVADEYGVCEHGRVVHYRYPCRQCLGWRGYVRLRIWGIWNDFRKRRRS